MNRTLFFFISLFVVENAFAAGDGVPHQTVFSQLSNIALLIAILYFSQRKTIAEAFRNKKEEYLANVNAASKSKKAAADKLKEVKSRVTHLTKTFDEQIEDAKRNASNSYKDQIAHAKNEALRVKSFAKTSLEFEVQKEIENLRVETFKKSVDLAEKNLESKLTPEQLKAWNSHFSSQTQGAH